ncbi:MAG: hypothetical protein QUV05_16975 [Phycisphaerae bacterium]|nr:hypothetical protein [Phycisphaerae bacterium]
MPYKNDESHSVLHCAMNVSDRGLSNDDGISLASSHGRSDTYHDHHLPCRHNDIGYGRLTDWAMGRRLGVSRIEVAVILTVAAIILVILLTSLGRGRELSRRGRCQANLVLIGKGLWSYVSGSEINYPITGPTSMANDAPIPVTYFNMTGRHGGAVAVGDPGSQPLRHYWSELSTTRNLWLLMKSASDRLSVGSFICPSSGDNPDTVGDPASFWDFPARPGDRTDDRGWEPANNNEKCVSYGYQVPYGRKGRASTEVEAGMVIVADKGPYGGVSLSNSQVKAPPANLAAEAGSAGWRPFNSPNHGGLMAGDGQNVLLGDLHAEFVKTPIVGVGRDNIYTAWKRQGDQVDLESRLYGDRPNKVAPYNSLTPAADTDSLIYP